MDQQLTEDSAADQPRQQDSASWPQSDGRGSGDAPGGYVAFDAVPPVEGLSRRTICVFCGVMAVGVLGLLAWAVTPSSSRAETPATVSPADYAAMSSEALAKDGSPGAAHELAVRAVHGRPVDAVTVTDAIQRYNSPRLAVNYARMLALEQQKKQKAMMDQIEREQEYQPIY